MRELGLVGVGQSSWGPTLFGVVPRDPDRQSSIARTLGEQFHLDPSAVFWTVASAGGARIERIAGS